VIHYHGTPITPRARLYELAGRHFCVSYAAPRDVKVCHEIGQSVMLDNGAYTFWSAPEEHRGASPDWAGYYDWCNEWLAYPTTWAVIPDVIDGSEDDNDRLLVEWFTQRLPRGAPVWHLHESLERLGRLARGYERVCFGSSGRYAHVGSDGWRRRIHEAFDAISNQDGTVSWVHMLRGMDLAGDYFPFASADSTNVARNHNRSTLTVGQMAAEIDGRQCPALWRPTGTQLEVTA
jgi:hypothetical protein